MVLIIIVDLDNPFEGTWKVNLDNWHDFRDRIDPFPHIIFVHSINNTWIDKVRNRLGFSLCKLSTLSNTGWFGIPWKGLIKRIQARHSPLDMNRVIRWDKVYADQFFDHGYKKFIDHPVFPFVILKLGDEMSELLSCQEITNCPDLIRFEKTFNEKMVECFSWYQLSI